MSWIVSTKQYIPAVIGEAWGGGYFAGYISHTADGNPTHALIVAPRATGASGTGYTLTSNLTYAANVTAPDGINYSTTVLGASFTGSITGTTMTVTAVASGKIKPGYTIKGSAVSTNTTVVSQINGTTDGAGDYTVSISQTLSSRTLTATTSDFDGVANGTLFKNIDNTVGAGSTVFPAANFCEALSIGGYTDWYLPSRFELDIAYFNLKPDTTSNHATSGTNIYAVPQRNSNYSAGYPMQTALTAWQATSGSEAFVADRTWSSTDGLTAQYGSWISFSNGQMSNDNNVKSTAYRVRAFRRIAL